MIVVAGGVPGRRAARSAIATACCSSPTKCSPASAAPGRCSRASTPGISPDIICLSKALTAGYLPLGATVATEPIYDVVPQRRPAQDLLPRPLVHRQSRWPARWRRQPGALRDRRRAGARAPPGGAAQGGARAAGRAPGRRRRAGDRRRRDLELVADKATRARAATSTRSGRAWRRRSSIAGPAPAAAGEHRLLHAALCDDGRRGRLAHRAGGRRRRGGWRRLLIGCRIFPGSRPYPARQASGNLNTYGQPMKNL